MSSNKAYARQTQASKSKAAARPTRNPLSPPSTVASSSRSAIEPSPKATYGSPSFEENVLHRHGITINRNTRGAAHDPFRHFDSSRDERTYDFYTRDSDLHANETWVDTSEASMEGIWEEYQCLKIRKDNEAEHAQTAREYLFKRGARRLHSFKQTKFASERVIQPVHPPDEGNWRIPPVLNETPADLGYKWDARPDCSYWITASSFNQDYRSKIFNVTQAHANIAICPYVSIEFKRDSASTLNAARHQIAIAAAIALYNRWRLKEESLNLARQEWSSQESEHLRHYGITFHLSSCEIWSIEPAMSEGQWQGCTMQLLATTNCDDPAGIRNTAEWINEIHWWGLTSHGPDCKRDIKRLIEATPKAARPSYG